MVNSILESFDDPLSTRIGRSYDLFIEVKPQAKQSTRFSRGRAYTPAKKVQYIKEIQSQVSNQFNTEKFSGTIRLSVAYSFPWRKKDSKLQKKVTWAFMNSRPDVDNLFKPLADSLESICFNDDKEIVEIRVKKIRSDHTYIAVRIEEISPGFNEREE